MLPFKQRSTGRGASACYITSMELPVHQHRRCHKVVEPLHHSLWWNYALGSNQTAGARMEKTRHPPREEKCRRDVHEGRQSHQRRFAPWIWRWQPVSKGCQGCSQNVGAAFRPSSAWIWGTYRHSHGREGPWWSLWLLQSAWAKEGQASSILGWWCKKMAFFLCS